MMHLEQTLDRAFTQLKVLFASTRRHALLDKDTELILAGFQMMIYWTSRTVLVNVFQRAIPTYGLRTICYTAQVASD